MVEPTRRSLMVNVQSEQKHAVFSAWRVQRHVSCHRLRYRPPDLSFRYGMNEIRDGLLAG